MLMMLYQIILVNDDNFKVLKTVSNTIQETFSVTDEALFKARGTELLKVVFLQYVDPTKFNITPVLGQKTVLLLCHKLCWSNCYSDR
jgi:hypothetical protein